MFLCANKSKHFNGETGQNFMRLLNCTRGLNCTRTNLHEGTKLHERTKLHEDNFTPRVNFAQVTILHGGSFLYESKKTQK